MNDERLLLHYYADGLGDAERRDVETALAADPALSARYDELRRQLDALKSPVTTAAPPDMIARFHDTIERAAREEERRAATGKSTGGFHLMSFAWGGIMAAVLFVGIGISVYVTDENAHAPPAVPVAAAPSGAFTRGLRAHLAKSNDDIATVPIDTASDRALLVRHIVQQNRIFELAAEQNGSQNLARVLRAFEPVLVELARKDLSPERAAALRSQLTFELNVVLTKLSRDTSEATDRI